ncbi:MAG: PIN domain-containing protein [Chloroflexota bacterium]|nr:PIN domain-containing protein [Chloroflexota bacterium]
METVAQRTQRRRGSPVFLDTAYVYALLYTRDRWHAAARAWEQRLAVGRRRLLTTEFVLAEIADGLAALRFRTHAVQAIDTLRSSPLVEVVPASSVLFAAALERFRARSDKDWGLSDCASFVVMEAHDLSEALTTDDHFVQAGYRALLLEDVRDAP